MNNFVLIAHRGFSSKAPENTMGSFRLAVDSSFTNIELDIQLTSDKVPVILHDAALERTTDGRGLISDHTLKTLRTLDAGSWFSDDYKGERIPTLQEVLTEFGSHTHLHLELKSDEPELAEVVAQVVKLTGLRPTSLDPFNVPNITITSFKLEQLQRSLEIQPGFLHAWLVPRIDNQIIETALRQGIGQLCPSASTITEQDVQAALHAGLSVRGQGIKTDEDLLRTYMVGAQGTTVNWPDRALSLISS